jgi:hypothetical protein
MMLAGSLLIAASKQNRKLAGGAAGRDGSRGRLDAPRTGRDEAWGNQSEAWPWGNRSKAFVSSACLCANTVAARYR